jgi:hypothetical protein
MNRRALYFAVIFRVISRRSIGFGGARNFQFGQNERLPTPMAQRRRESRREAHLRLLLLLRLENSRMLGN